MPSENMFISGHLDGAVRFWSGRAEKKIHEITDLHSDAVTSVSISPNGRYLLTNSRDHTLKLVDLTTYKVLSSFEEDSFLNSSNTNRASIASNGKYGVVGSRNGSIIIFSLMGNEIELEEIYEDQHVETVNAVKWQPDGKNFASVDSGGSLIVWE